MLHGVRISSSSAMFPNYVNTISSRITAGQFDAARSLVLSQQESNIVQYGSILLHQVVLNWRSSSVHCCAWCDFLWKEEDSADEGQCCCSARRLVYALVLYGAVVDGEADGGSVLSEAVRRGAYGAVQCLLQCGATVSDSVRTAAAQNVSISGLLSRYEPGLWAAVESGCVENVRRLLNLWCNIQLRRGEMTLRRLAVISGREDIISLIINIAPSLHCAYCIFSGASVKFNALLSSSQSVNVNLRCLSLAGSPLLYFAAVLGEAEMCRRLVERGASLTLPISDHLQEDKPLIFCLMDSCISTEVQMSVLPPVSTSSFSPAYSPVPTSNSNSVPCFFPSSYPCPLSCFTSIPHLLPPFYPDPAYHYTSDSHLLPISYSVSSFCSDSIPHLFPTSYPTSTSSSVSVPCFVPTWYPISTSISLSNPIIPTSTRVSFVSASTPVSVPKPTVSKSCSIYTPPSISTPRPISVPSSPAPVRTSECDAGISRVRRCLLSVHYQGNNILDHALLHNVHATVISTLILTVGPRLLLVPDRFNVCFAVRVLKNDQLVDCIRSALIGWINSETPPTELLIGGCEWLNDVLVATSIGHTDQLRQFVSDRRSLQTAADELHRCLLDWPRRHGDFLLLIEKLTVAGCEPALARATGDGTPLLIRAVLLQCLSAVHCLLDTLRVGIDEVRDGFRRTALHYASALFRQCPQLHRVLRQAGSSDHSLDIYGEEPLDFLQLSGTEQMEQLLLLRINQNYVTLEPRLSQVRLSTRREGIQDHSTQSSQCSCPPAPRLSKSSNSHHCIVL